MKSKAFLILSLVLALALLLVTPASAFFTPSTGQAATLVLGEPDFTSDLGATTQKGVNNPIGVTVDPTSGKVFVIDPSNNRVLRFDKMAALSNGAAAEGVLEQHDFTSSTAQTHQNGMNQPFGGAVDANGRLWVVDAVNSRVLRFDNAASKANGANADGVLGQPDFTSSTAQTTQNGMAYPQGVAVDSSGRLWIADSSNRALRFDNAAAKANGANADGVLGPPDFTSTVGNSDQSMMPDPHGLAVDASGRLWVGENDGSRVVRYDNAAAKANGANADGVLGQPDFSTFVRNLTQNGMDRVTAVAVDTSGRLYVADSLNSRVLVFNSPPNLSTCANSAH